MANIGKLCLKGTKARSEKVFLCSYEVRILRTFIGTLSAQVGCTLPYVSSCNFGV